MSLIAVLLALQVNLRCFSNILIILSKFSILINILCPASQTRTGDIAVSAQKCTGNVSRTSRTTAAHSTTELRRDNICLFSAAQGCAALLHHLHIWWWYLCFSLNDSIFFHILYKLLKKWSKKMYEKNYKVSFANGSLIFPTLFGLIFPFYYLNFRWSR